MSETRAIESIREAVKVKGDCSHNIIGKALHYLVDKKGRKHANDVIDEFKLGRFGFEKLPVGKESDR